MKNHRLALALLLVPGTAGLVGFTAFGPAGAGGPAHPPAPRAESFWKVEDVRRGMKGEGRTVLHGTKVETFTAEVLGVLRNTSPGRDLVLARLSGLGLEKTGVIAGMSGSPVYLDGKLLGAVAYAWAFGKEPIAGITPFAQMRGYAESFERRGVPLGSGPRSVGLGESLRVGGKSFDSVSVAQAFDDPAPSEGAWLVPLRAPLAATGFTPRSLRELARRCGRFGLVPVQSGGASGKVAEEERGALVEPGAPLAVSLVTGDFDLSGIGTVTHVEGSRVYGWGHPFMGLGGCDFPLQTAYIHTVYPRLTVSFKMGSPLRTLGAINADVSTGIAGWLGRKPDMLPVRMSVALGKDRPRTFDVRVARHRALTPTLVYTALLNSVDMEGELPEEMTALFEARVEVDGHEPVVIKDLFSGFSGGRAPQALYSPVASVLGLLQSNPYQPLRVKRVECQTQVLPGRRTAEIEAVELDSDTYRPGEVVKAHVFVRPYKGSPQRVTVSLKLPPDLPEGHYTATVCDGIADARMHMRADPTLFNPEDVGQVLRALKVQTDARRTNLVLRVPVGAGGVASNGKALPHLPASMVHILVNGRRTGAQTIREALVARRDTEWVIQGADTVRFTVTKARKVTRDEEW